MRRWALLVYFFSTRRGSTPLSLWLRCDEGISTKGVPRSFLFFLLTFILGSKCFGMLRGGTNRPRHSLSTWFHKKEREEWASKVRLPFFFITLYYVFNPPTAGSLTKGLDFNTRRKDDPSLRLRSPRFRHQEEGWPFISVPVVAGCIQN